jgi:arylsulfatase A-like enzyme
MKICILLVDCMRPDHLGCYGYHKNTSPCMDRIAENCLLCESVYAQSNWTYPSVYAMLTGRYPTVLNVNWFDQRINNRFHVLPERLAQIGYRNTIFSNFKVLLNGQGFCSHFDDVEEVGIDDNALPAFTRWVEQKEDGFLFFHIGEYVHEPYFAPKHLVDRFLENGDPGKRISETELIHILTSRNTSGNILRKSIGKINRGLQPVTKLEIDRLLAHYDAGIYYIDGMIEKYYNLLKSCGDDYLFILTADHGQAFMEHGFIGHGLSLYDEVIKVPLLIDFGQQHHGRIKTDLQLIDLYPTILAHLGLDTESDIDGISFWDGIVGKKVQDKPIFSEGFPHVTMIHNRQKLISGYSRHWNMKTVYSQFMKHHRTTSWVRMIYSYLQRFRKPQLFDLHTDPYEHSNLVRTRVDLVDMFHEDISSKLNLLLTKSLAAEKISLHKDIENQLEKLGYL